MDQDIVQCSTGVTLVGAGHPIPEDIDDALKFAPYLAAADGGADHAIAAGHIPAAVIGDFDSLSIDASAQLAGSRLVRIYEQETTDFEKCLTHLDAPFVIATGFTSGRADHALAAFSVLARRIGPPTVIVGAEDVIFAADIHADLDLEPGTRVSLFPLSDTTGTSEGLEWRIDGLMLSPGGRLGTSNLATGPVRLSFDRPGVLIILPRAALPAALACVTSG